MSTPRFHRDPPPAPSGLPARLPGHLRHDRGRGGRPRGRARRRPRPPLHAGLPLRQGQPLPRPRLQSRAAAPPDAASGEEGRGPLRADLVGRGARHRGLAPAGDRGRARAAGHPALLLRRQHGPSRLRQHGPALLPRARGEPPRPDDLLVGRRPRLQGHRRQDDGLRPRGDRARAPHRGLGGEPRQLERAPLAVRRGGEEARGAARVRRPLPLAHRGEVRPAPGAVPGHRRRARPGDDARRLPRRARGPGVARPLHGRPRGAARAGARVDPRPDGGGDRPAAGGDRVVRARVRDDAALGPAPQLRPEPPRRGRHGGPDDRVPPGGGRGLARRRRRRAPLHLGHLPGGHGCPRAARPRPPGDAHPQHEPARAHPDRRDARAAGEGALRLQLEPGGGRAGAGRGPARSRSARTSSSSSTSSSRPTPPTSRTSCCRRPRPSSTTTSTRRTATSTSASAGRRSRRSGRRSRTRSSSAGWPRAWGSTTRACATPTSRWRDRRSTGTTPSWRGSPSSGWSARARCA